MLTLLADISGQQVINAVIWLAVAGLIYWILLWVIDTCGLPEPFNKIARVLLALTVAIILINALLSFTGHGFISW